MTVYVKHNQQWVDWASLTLAQQLSSDTWEIMWNPQGLVTLDEVKEAMRYTSPSDKHVYPSATTGKEPLPLE
jgi:negative regulator of sigma E activity